MGASTVYLDTSSVVKRYIGEAGSNVADAVYARAEAGAYTIGTSLWNLGEVMGVLDGYRSRRLLSEASFLSALRSFLSECEKMIRLGSMQILPLGSEILIESYMLILKHHIYQADALQIATCKVCNCNLFLSADRELLKVAKAEGIDALDMERDARQIMSRLA